MFFLTETHSILGSAATRRMELQEKKMKKQSNGYRKSVWKEPTIKNASVNSRLKTIQVIGYRK